MKFKMKFNERVLTSPYVERGVIVIDGGEFEDGMFRVVAPESTSGEVIATLEATVMEIDGMLGRRRWIADLLSADRPNGGRDA